MFATLGLTMPNCTYETPCLPFFSPTTPTFSIDVGKQLCLQRSVHVVLSTISATTLRDHDLLRVGPYAIGLSQFRGTLLGRNRRDDLRYGCIETFVNPRSEHTNRDGHEWVRLGRLMDADRNTDPHYGVAGPPLGWGWLTLRHGPILPRSRQILFRGIDLAASKSFTASHSSDQSHHLGQAGAIIGGVREEFPDSHGGFAVT